MQSEKLHKQGKIPDLNQTLVENSSGNKIKQVCLRGVIYARYSDGGNQTEQSIEGQLRDCYEYANKNNIRIVGEYLDPHISGKNADKRLEFQRMIEDSDKHLFDVVIVWKTDRFARNRYDSARYKERLKRNGVTIRYAAENIPDTAEGIILESMLEGMAEYYSADLQQKIKRGMRESAYKLKVLTQPPLGYKVDDNRHYMIDESTAPFIRQIFEMYVAGEKLSTIARKVNLLGLRTIFNNPLTVATITQIIRNEKYIGVYEYKNGGIRVEDAFPAVIDKGLFYEAQKRMIAQKNGSYTKKNYGASAKRIYPLSGLVYCGECKGHMFGESIVRYRGTDREQKYVYYACANHRKRKGCNITSIPADALEEAVKSAVKRVLMNPIILDVVCQATLQIDKKLNLNGRLNALKQQKKKKEVGVQNIVKVIEAGTYSDTLIARLKELEKEIYYLNEKIKHCSTSDESMKEKIINLLTSYETNSENDAEYWSDIFHCFVKSVTCFENGTVIIRFNLYHAPNPDGPVFALEVSDNIDSYMAGYCRKPQNVWENLSGLHQSECLFGNGFHQNDFRTNSFFC